MRKNRPRLARLVAFAILLSSVPLRFAGGATYVLPRDLGELARASDAIVLAQAGAPDLESRGRLVFRHVPFLVLESVAGPLRIGASCDVKLPGGLRDDGSGWHVPGSPVFREGEVYLLFLDQVREGSEWVPAALAYGILAEARAADGARFLVPLAGAAGSVLPRPDGNAAEEPGIYRTERLLDLLAAVVGRSAEWRGDEAAATPEELALLDRPQSGAGVPAGCAYFADDRGRPLRWRTFDQGGRAEIAADETGDLSLGGGGFARIVGAMDLWMDITDTGLNLVFAGTTPLTLGCGGGDNAQADTIVFNDPCSDMGDLDGCAGVLAFGGPLVDGSVHTHDGSTWVTVTGWIVVVNNGAGCLGDSNYERMMAHELGHGLGWGHVNDAGALMFATCCHDPNGTDRGCAQFTYPPRDATNRRPRVDAGGDRTLVLTGNTASVSAVVSDDGLPASPGTVTTRWRQLAGAGRADFEEAAVAATRVRFSRSGTYVLGLEASDGELVRTAAFTAEVEIYSGSRGVATFAQRQNGYRGARDTFVQENAPAADNSGVTELAVDADDPANSGQQSQALVIFDDIFGGGARQVPPGAAIAAAFLTLESTNFGDGAELHRMVVPWETDAAWSDFGPSGVEPGVHATARADAVVAGLAERVTIDVTSSVAAWSRDPCANHGWAFLPRGGDGWDFFSSEGGAAPELRVEYVLAPSEGLIGTGATWQYRAGTSSPPADWREPGFVPNGDWDEGPAGIGFGDGDDATELADMRGNYAVVYCRRTFELASPERADGLILRVDYDDGFVAFLNGVEVARSASMGVAGDPATRTTLARDSHEAGVFEEFSLAPDALRSGENVLAIQVHNQAVDSSDLSFDCSLEAHSAILSSRALWRFRRGSEALPSDWREPDFDDSAWEVGLAGIGFGDGDDMTVLDDMRGAYASFFCRAEFALSATDRGRAVIATVVHDDGVVLHVNGTEVGRANMPSGAVETSTTAASAIEPTATTFVLPAALLRDGRNVLAASVHNASLDSSDVSFMAVVVTPAGRGEEVPCDEAPPAFRRGEVIEDGVLNLTDGISLLNHLFLGGAAPVCPDAADIDDDGSLGLTDGVSLFNFLFLQGVAPATPGTLCGVDPTPDGLGDCATADCPP